MFDITQTTFEKTYNARVDTYNVYSTAFELKYLVWDENTHTNLKYSAAILGAGLAYAAYSKWFK